MKAIQNRDTFRYIKIDIMGRSKLFFPQSSSNNFFGLPAPANGQRIVLFIWVFF